MIFPDTFAPLRHPPSYTQLLEGNEEKKELYLSCFKLCETSLLCVAFTTRFGIRREERGGHSQVILGSREETVIRLFNF